MLFFALLFVFVVVGFTVINIAFKVLLVLVAMMINPIRTIKAPLQLGVK